MALDKPGTVTVKAKVAFAAEQPLGTAVGGHGPQGKTRKVELVVNGVAVASQGRAGRRQGARPRLRRADRKEQLGGAAALPAAAHQPGERARRRQADPGLAPECPVVRRRDRATLAGAGEQTSPSANGPKPRRLSSGPRRSIGGSRPKRAGTNNVIFDLFLTGPPAGAGASVSVRQKCLACGHEASVAIWNGTWNRLSCANCRRMARQFLHACLATIDPLTRRVGHLSARQHYLDWRQFGPMPLCLGPIEERRVLLCLQLRPHGLPRRPLQVHCTIRRIDSERPLATWRATWSPCPCSGGACKHNRLVRWLPPTDVWDQKELDCEIRVTGPNGERLLDDRIRFDITPPELAAGQDDEVLANPSALGRAGASPSQSPSEVVDGFHNLYYYGAAGDHPPWVRTFWMNVPCIQCPLDLWVYQEIITETRPDLVVETGTLFGGTSLFLAHTLDAVGNGSVISIDLEDLPRPAHPRIEYAAGSSTDSELVHRLLADRRPDETRMVILDSAHHAEHVLREMKLFAPFVTLGSYLIVTDSNTNGHPVFPDFGPGPFEAVGQFLGECEEFHIDATRQKHLLTFNPNGYLKRVRPAGETVR